MCCLLIVLISTLVVYVSLSSEKVQWKHKTLPLYSSHRTLLHVPESYRGSNDDPKPGLTSSGVSTETNAGQR